MNSVFRSLKEIEWKILVVFYGNGDVHNYFYLKDIVAIMGIPEYRVQYHLKKLVELKLIVEVGSYPKFWEPTKNDALRQEIRNNFTNYMNQWFDHIRKAKELNKDV
jgi:hypothetical protein